MKSSKIIFFLSSFAFASQIVDAGSPSYVQVTTVIPPSSSSSKPNNPDAITCSRTFDLYDSNRNYLSSVCALGTNLSATTALEQCRSIDLTLFTITSYAEYKALMLKTANTYGKSVGPAFWISGVQINGTYYDSNDNSQTIDTSTYDFYSLDMSDDYGNCLRAGRNNDSFVVFKTDCAHEDLSAFCKFSKL